MSYKTEWPAWQGELPGGHNDVSSYCRVSCLENSKPGWISVLEYMSPLSTHFRWSLRRWVAVLVLSVRSH